jgi:starch-binding outer membrane protein, SusD/RagB family
MTIFSKYIKILSILLLLFIVTSCSDFLEEKPKDRISTSNYYTTEEDAISAVRAIYAYFNSQSEGLLVGIYTQVLWATVGLASDEMKNNQAGNSGAEQLSSFVHNPQTGDLYSNWTMHYQALKVANIAIERIPKIQMNEARRTDLVNEARFLRGLLYFNLVRLYGRVPLLIKEDEPLYPSVAEVTDIYAQIIADFTAAENLPSKFPEGRGRASKGAAKALLAKVYLTMAGNPLNDKTKYELAATKAKEVIDMGADYGWGTTGPAFGDMFKIVNRGLPASESIFTVGFGTTGTGGGNIIFWETGQFHVALLPSQLVTAGITSNTLGWRVPTQALADSYAPEDLRRNVTVFNEFTPDGKPKVAFDKYYFKKYWDTSDPNELAALEDDQDFRVIRFADVLLMYAEVLNELDRTNEAYQYINKVRNRAGLADLSGLTKDQFRDKVLEERKLELACEGHRWFDLVRTGALEKYVPIAKPGLVPTKTHYLFPIPQRERDINKNLPQNEGY